MLPAAPYLPTRTPGTFESTPLARAGWSDDGQHGGVVAALLAHQIEKVPTLAPMELARLTVELFRLVPVTPLQIVTSIEREGKRVQLVRASALGPDGTELARANGLRLRTTSMDLPASANTKEHRYPLPADIPAQAMERWGIGHDMGILYHRNAIEVREIDGGFARKGPGAMWVRVIKPLIAGEPLTPTVRAVVAGDFLNGLSRLVDVADYSFMNADLTIHLTRPPQGDWIGVNAQSQYESVGRGVASGELFDTGSIFGRSSQTLFLTPN